MTIQVTKLRKFGQVSAMPIQSSSFSSNRRNLAICFPKELWNEVEVGSVWEVSGDISTQTYDAAGWQHIEDLLTVEKAKCIRLTGQMLAFWIAENIPGVGEIIGKRIAETNGVGQAVKASDVEFLCQIPGVSRERAEALIAKWPDENEMAAIEWIQDAALSPVYGRRIIRVFGPKATEVLSQDPFLLLSVGASWAETMRLAQRVGYSIDHPATKAAVAARAASVLTAKTGDLGFTEDQLVNQAMKILSGSDIGPELVEAAVDRGALIRVGECGLMSMGAALLESSVARFLHRAAHPTQATRPAFTGCEGSLSEQRVKNSLVRFEQHLTFALTSEQKDAIVGSVMAPVACITGGAGTGKTTILKGILAVSKEVLPGLTVKLVALSGRAARRMSESAGMEAFTIAKLIGDHIGEGKNPLTNQLLLIIDEASMVDIVTMYRLCGILPEATRILFVGDVAQLPPVGPGLVFHGLIKAGQIPAFSLAQVKRQSQLSGIHRFATGIRDGKLLELPSAKPALADSEDACLESNVSIARAYGLWVQAGGRDSAQVLSPIRKGALGTNQINSEFQINEGLTRKAVIHPSAKHGYWLSVKGQKFFEGDPVMVNQNDYELDVRNGDLGHIQEAWSEPDEDGAVGIVLLDSTPMPITMKLLEKLELAYAITVHKSQGSQWSSVILTLPPDARGMIDQALLYTGVTRASERLIVMGEQATLLSAINRGNVAAKRQTCLGGLLRQMGQHGSWFSTLTESHH